MSEFELKNADGIILGERENIVGGIDSSFTLDLQPGTYTLNCPNGDTEDNGDTRRHRRRQADRDERRSGTADEGDRRLSSVRRRADRAAARPARRASSPR